MGPDWSLLPPELLQATAEKITSLADYIRFRAVCRPWRCAASPIPRHLPVQLPWLMLPYYGGTENPTRLFHDLSSSKIRRLDLPETCGAKICGSAHGWLVLHDGWVTSLLNPLTRATVNLPSFAVPPAAFVPSNDQGNTGKNGLNPTKEFTVYMATLTLNPCDPSCLVFIATSTAWQLAFCKIGDECWTVIEYRSPDNWLSGIVQDFCYSNGFLYTVNYSGVVKVYNIGGPSKVLLPGLHPRPHIDASPDLYLVEGTSSDVLLVEYRERINASHDEYNVYKLSSDEPNMIKVTDMGQNVVFLVGRYCIHDRSFSRVNLMMKSRFLPQAHSFSSANLQLQGWGRNCICYNSKRSLDSTKLSFNHNIKLANLDNGKVTNVTSDLGTFEIRNSVQNSLWLTPSLL